MRLAIPSGLGLSPQAETCHSGFPTPGLPLLVYCMAKGSEQLCLRLSTQLDNPCLLL